MAPPRIALIHALPMAAGPIAEAFARLWPEPRLTNLLDDSLSADRAADGTLTPAMIGRFVTLARYCAGSGADGILFTCSAFGPAIEAAAAAVSVPVLKPNEAMLADALELAARGRGRIAMLATFEPSIGSLAAESREMADARGQSIELRTRHVPGAMAELDRGDDAAHNALVVASLDAWDGWKDCDALLLAQFSLSRARGPVTARSPIPVLVSPDSAVLALRRAMQLGPGLTGAGVGVTPTPIDPGPN